MNRRLTGAALGGVLLVATAGVLVAAEDSSRGPALIPGDQPVTEAQVRDNLQSEGYSNVKIIRQGEYFQAIGTKEGTTDKIVVDAQTGRLARQGEGWHGGGDDDDDD